MPAATAFATLTGALLARKGDARPAMRRQLPDAGAARVPGDDLGWDDMGPSQPPVPAVLHERAALAAELAGGADARKVAFTLRLDAARHGRLRRAAAQDGQSAQRWLVSALDGLLDRRADAATRTKDVS